MTIFVDDPLAMLNALMIYKEDKWHIDTVGDDFESPRGNFARLEDALNALIENGTTGDLGAPFDGILRVLFPDASAELAITQQPQDVSSDVNGDATLSVEAVGENLTYEWYQEIDPDSVVNNAGGYEEDATNIEISGATSLDIDVGSVTRSESDELLYATAVDRFLANFDATRGYRGTTPQPLSDGESIPFFNKIEGADANELNVRINETTRFFCVVGDGESYVVSVIATATYEGGGGEA